MKIYIYGAKSIALGVCRAMQVLYPSHTVEGFFVSSLVGNPITLAGLPVREMGAFVSSCSSIDRSEIHVLIAVPENLHGTICENLEEYNFSHYTCITSEIEADLMRRYFEVVGGFKILDKLQTGVEKVSLNVFSAKFHTDVILQGAYKLSDWIVPLQVGSALTNEMVAKIKDNMGENISDKNCNYCELTALYWMWKNLLLKGHEITADYYGLFHYRRILEVSEDDILRLKVNDVDVILPFPMLHEPNAFEHHTRYIKDSDWDAMIQALEELRPEYVKAIPMIFSQPYFYNYNMLIAKREILKNYCDWLFPVLARIEELSEPKGWERADRYIGYLGENLLTLYFMYNKDKYNIVHTGRRMLT